MLCTAGACCNELDDSVQRRWGQHLAWGPR
jgi:hypothetical protein